jgi:hypothetical protein
MMRAAAGEGSGVSGGGRAFMNFGEEDEEEGAALGAAMGGEDPYGEGWDEASGPLRSTAAEQAEVKLAEEEAFADGGEGVGGMQVKLDARQLLARQGLLEEDEEDGGRGRGGMRGGGGGGKAAQRAAAGEVEGSLWWHRNFAPADEALVRAQVEAIE